jgi:hypothetical protein
MCHVEGKLFLCQDAVAALRLLHHIYS